MKKLRIGKHFLPLKILIPILLISVLSLVSYAASVTVTQVNTQAVAGVMYNIVGGFTVANDGFGLTAVAEPATTPLPTLWVPTGIVTTATTLGNWQYSVTVTINSAATAGTTYTVSVQWSTNGAGYIAMGTDLTFTTPSSITPTQTMTFTFDTGVNTFIAPAGIVITIHQ